MTVPALMDFEVVYGMKDDDASLVSCIIAAYHKGQIKAFFRKHYPQAMLVTVKLIGPAEGHAGLSV